MALGEIPELRAYLRVLPEVKRTPNASVWLTYDREADVMYVNFRKPSVAVDSELTDDDIIIRYDEADEVVGFTILHAGQR
jgi:uncharacterized protein YuzE